jgi:hypothetical protein
MNVYINMHIRYLHSRIFVIHHTKFHSNSTIDTTLEVVSIYYFVRGMLFFVQSTSPLLKWCQYMFVRVMLFFVQSTTVGTFCTGRVLEEPLFQEESKDLRNCYRI